MGLQISSSLEGLGALITFEGQLAPVSLHVGVKVPLVLQLGRAHGTGVGGVLPSVTSVQSCRQGR